MKNNSEQVSQDITGIYQYEGDTITVSIHNDKVIAQDQNGVSVPPMEVVLSGHKLSDEEAQRIRERG